MVAVVGGRGFIGAAIVRRLKAAGLPVTVVTHSPACAREPGFRYGDLLVPSTLAAAVEGAEIVIQSANFRSYPIESPRRGHTFAAFDGEGTERLLAAAGAAGARRYVFIAGAGTRSGGDKPYWNALRRGEAAVLEAGLEGVCIEPTLVFGPEDRGLNRLIAFARRARFAPIVGSGAAVHQPVFVEDVAELVYRSLPTAAPQGVFAIGGPERMPMRELVRRTLAIAGVRCPIVRVPARPLRSAAVLARHLPGEPVSSAAIDFMQESFIADLEPVWSSFSLSPRMLEQGLRTYLPAGARGALV